MDEGLDLELGKKRSQLSYTSNAEYKPRMRLRALRMRFVYADLRVYRPSRADQ